MTPEIKQEINNMTYKEMLIHWRFDPVGSVYFSGEVGHYFEKVMLNKRDELTREGEARISREIGWN